MTRAVDTAIQARQINAGSAVATPGSGSTVTIPSAYNTYSLTVSPAAALAALTISLPATAYDGATINITFAQPVTRVTWVNGIRGLPVQIGLGYSVVLHFNSSAGVWYAMTRSAGISGGIQTQKGFTKTFQSRVAQALANGGNVKVMIIGDENTSGFGANTTNSYTGAFAKSMPNNLASTKLPFSLPTNHWAGNQIAPTDTIANFLLYDTRFAATGGASTWNPPQFGGALSFTGTIASTITFTPGSQFDRIEIGLTTATGNSVGSVTVGGNNVGTLNSNAPLGISRVNIDLSSLASSFVINYPGTGGGLPIAWVRTWKSTESSIHIMQAGWNGAKIADWNTTTQVYQTKAAMQLLAPDLVIVNGLVLNDAIAATTAATWATSFTTLKDTIRTTGAELAYITSINYQPVGGATWTNARALNAQARLSCDQWDVPMLEMEYEWLPSAGYTANYSDTRNPSGTGYAVQAALVSQFIESLAGV
jgi:hypothetical protein